MPACRLPSSLKIGGRCVDIARCVRQSFPIRATRRCVLDFCKHGQVARRCEFISAPIFAPAVRSRSRWRGLSAGCGAAERNAGRGPHRRASGFVRRSLRQSAFRSHRWNVECGLPSSRCVAGIRPSRSADRCTTQPSCRNWASTASELLPWYRHGAASARDAGDTGTKSGSLMCRGSSSINCWPIWQRRTVTAGGSDPGAQIKMSYNDQHYQTACQPVPQLDALMQRRREGRLVSYARPLTARASTWRRPRPFGVPRNAFARS